MFKDNKYTTWYNKIISHIQSKDRLKIDGHIYEEHHIIPKSMGGSNTNNNLVLCTPREHYILHLLLVRMVSSNNVYKMVSAIARFNNKAHGARSYDLLRKTMSKYSIGKYNKAFGRKWCHDKDHNIFFMLPEDIPSNYTMGLPKQMGGIPKGNIWINKNGNRTVIDKSLMDEYLEAGWMLGRDVFLPTSHYDKISTLAKSPERRQNQKEKMTGKVDIINPTTKERKKIYDRQIDDYLNLGFIPMKKSGLTTKNTYKCSIEGEVYASVNLAAKAIGRSYTYVKKRLNSTKYKDWFIVN